MCMRTPKVSDPVQYQQSQDPVYREATSSPSTTRGRRSTILSSSSSGSTSTLATRIGEASVAPKRTVLGG